MSPRRRSLSVCSTPGCPEFAECDGRCLEHHREHEAAYRERNPRPSPRALGYDSEWEKTRAAFLRAVGATCWECGTTEGRIDVHHVEGGPADERGRDWTNLVALCVSCHTRRTNRARAGGGA